MTTKLTVAPDNDGLRLDSLLAKHDDSKSRSTWAKMITSGHITLNGITVKPKQQVSTGDMVAITEMVIENNPIPVETIYQDENLIVINKPYGLLSHKKNNLDSEFTVEDFLKSLPHKNLSKRNGIVHRLDRTTSGVMVCALNEKTEIDLKQQFAQRSVKKQYIACLSNRPKEDEALIDLPIGRNPKKPSKFRVDSKGKPSQTRFRVIKYVDNRALVELLPYTGRTHQLRVHMAYIGCPILGDELYGGDKYTRLMLHAKSLTLTLSDSTTRTFESSAPSEFNL